MNVLSLFDGISCGRLALQRAGIPVEKYYASEIDKYAIKVTMANFPDTIQLGDVSKIDFKQFTGKIDMIIGGSPCQDLSISGKRAGLKGERSGLFYKFVEAIQTIKPKYFLLENNVGMPREAYLEMSRLMGCYPVEINSALVSAQNRRRYYWTNIRLKQVLLFGLPHSDIPQPEDKGIILQDVLEEGLADRIKSFAVYATDYKGNGKDTLLYATRHKVRPYKAIRLGILNNGGQAQRVYSVKSKSVTLSSNGGGQGAKTGLYRVNLPDGDYIIRRLTPVECERLQTLPDGYTEGISNTQRYKCLGNGWTVDVITHIFSFIQDKEE